MLPAPEEINPVPATDADPWTAMQDHCAVALSVSRDLLARLESGAEATELVPLLQKEQHAVEGVRSGIAQFGDRLPADGAAKRDEVASHLTELLRLDGLSRDLLARRGVRLRGPRFSGRTVRGTRPHGTQQKGA